MSASRMPTVRPCFASASAKFTVTDDLPTPPLPEATAITLVRFPGCANGICFAGLPPRSMVRMASRCSSFITPSSTAISRTPSTARRAVVTRVVISERIGQPETVRSTRTATSPPSVTWMSSTMPRSVMGRRISGSSTS